MPIYEYRCDSCGHELEKLQRISEEPLKDCPACAEASLRRLISPAGFRLKGSGWYETDFKKANKRNVLEKSGDASAASEKTADSAASADSQSSENQSSEKSSDKKPEKATEKTKTETKSSDKGSKSSVASGG